VPLDAQDPAAWDRTLSARGEQLLTRAHTFGRPGRFQYEAAIQSLHCSRMAAGPLDAAGLQTLLTLHLALVRVSPTLGAKVALAAVRGELDGPEAGLRALDAEGGAVADFQPAAVLRAHLLGAAGERSAAAASYRHAIGLTSNPRIVEYLEECLQQLRG
jgi:RNA polymerase sigma-70 factor, ECF subfamily